MARLSLGNVEIDAESVQYGKVPACVLERCAMTSVIEANDPPRRT